MSKKANPVEDGIALISVHHVTPVYEDAIIRTCDLLDEIGIDSYSLLVTPFYKMKRKNTFEKHDLFSNYLISLDQELSLHGYSLQTKSGTQAEFQRMSREQMDSRLRLGVNFMKKSFKSTPIGFIPPLWLAPSSIVGISKKLKLKYCVVGNDIHSIPNGNRLTTAHHIICQETPLSKSDAYLELELGGPVQISLHPHSFFKDDLYDMITDMKDRLGYKFVGYAEYLKENEPQ